MNPWGLKRDNPVLRGLRGAVSLLQGLAITFSYLFKPAITVQYPEKRALIPLRYRGRLVLPVDPDKGTDRCTACMRCVKICPNHSIDIEKEVGPDGRPRPRAAKYLYNVGTCIFCNLCVETCPFFAIVMSDDHELATTDKQKLVIDLVAEKRRLTGKKGKWWQLKFKAREEELET